MLQLRHRRPKMTPSPHLPYSPDEVLANFNALLADIDFKTELTRLGIGRRHFFLRRKMVEELTALTLGLWHLALERSFPEDCETLFETFLSRRLCDCPPKQAQRFEEKTRAYVAMLETHKDRDFTGPGGHLVSLLTTDKQNKPTLRLRLTLLIRNLYTLIFERLI